MLLSFFFLVPYQATSFPLCFQGGVHRLESVEEYNELMVQNGDPRIRMLEVSRDGRKHSLPQLLESSTAQVGSVVEPLAFSSSHRGPVRDERACFHHPGVSRLPLVLPKTSESFYVLNNCPSVWARGSWD